ncbi:glycosyltransferase [Patescibacteria group bacterium]|nr:glycosyltransferase [Patescibacteria group bacterium]
MFTIITPTYKRPSELMRAVQSVIAQSVPDWEMIIVNDNPGDGATEAIKAFYDSRIHILENDSNRGVNYSRNRGLEKVSSQSVWVIFLDDDDTLAPEALAKLTALIATSPSPWIVTARGTNESTPTTTGESKKMYSYIWDYLITRRFKGDATHCVNASLLTKDTHKLRFPTTIKQAEEWLFYAELGTYTRFYYEPIVTTLTSGYDATGLNLRTRSTSDQLRLIPTIIREASGRNLYLSPLFWLYVKMRIIRAFIK